MLEIGTRVATKGAMNCNLSSSQVDRFDRFFRALPLDTGFLALV